MIKPPPLTFILSLLSLLVAAPGCSSDADPDPDPDDTPGRADGGSSTPDAEPDAEPVPPDAAPQGFAISGDVTGSEIPADAEVVAMWPVSVPTDHAAKWGDGTSSGSQFTFALSDAPPPPFVLNEFGGGTRVGIGFLVLVPTGTALPDGVLDPEQELDLLGVAATPIIWREGTVSGELRWLNAFEEETYQCGRCVPADDEESFDTFEPIDCSEVEITTPLEGLDCNFT